MKAVFLDYESLDQHDLDLSALEASFDTLSLYPSTSQAQLLERVQHADVIISNKVIVDAATIQQCPNLKLILISATGTNNIDLVQARAQGIVVFNCHGYGTCAVALLTLTLIFAFFI